MRRALIIGGFLALSIPVFILVKVLDRGESANSSPSPAVTSAAVMVELPEDVVQAKVDELRMQALLSRRDPNNPCFGKPLEEARQCHLNNVQFDSNVSAAAAELLLAEQKQ